MPESGRAAEAAELLARGRAEIERKAHAEAVDTLTRALEARPGDVDILFFRGLARLRLGEWEAAERDYAALLERNPEHGDGRFNRAYCLGKAGKGGEAEAEFTRYLERRPEDWEAFLERAKVRLSMERAAGAAEDLDRAAGLKPGHADIHFQRGRARMALGRWDEAIRDFEESLKLNPEFTNVFYNRAWCRGKMGDHAGAVEDYDRYLKLYPDHADAFLYRGNRRFDLCDLRGTLADYEKALALDPALEKDLRTWIDLVRRMEKLERDGPNDQFVAACVERGAAKRDGGENATALLWFDRALEVDPDAAEALHGRALTQLNLQRYPEAVAGLTRAVEIRPGAPAFWHDRGRARRLAGDAKASIADFNRALELQADFAPSFAGRAYSFIVLEDFASAAKDYERYVELEPQAVADVWYNLGWARRKLGKAAGAVEAYTRAIQLSPGDADAYVQRGHARKEAGDREGARADYRKAIELKPEYKAAMEQALAELADPAPRPPGPARPPAAASEAPPVPLREGLGSAVRFYLIPCAVVVVLGLSGIPVLGDIPRRVLDMPYKAAWIVSHWNDARAFPAESDLCMEPFCTRTDTREQYVGGRQGYTSQVDYHYCGSHAPTFFHMGSKHDGFLYFLYWGAILLLSALMVPAVAGAVFLLCWPVLLPRVLAGKAPPASLLPLLGPGRGKGAEILDGVGAWTGMAVVLAGWIAFAWW